MLDIVDRNKMDPYKTVSRAHGGGRDKMTRHIFIHPVNAPGLGPESYGSTEKTNGCRGVRGWGWGRGWKYPAGGSTLTET